MEKPVLFELDDHGIALITLNRPERRNALNQELLARLYDAIDEVAANPSIRVAILTGNGKSFSSGIDLAVIGTENLLDPRGDGKDFPDVIGACAKPVIGAVNGHAITGAFEIALNCDFLIASEKASFADTHLRVGLHPGWGMTQLLQEAVGRRMAMQLSLTGRTIDAAEALRIGLVNEVVPHHQLLPRARQIAGEICAANQEVLATVKEVIEFRDRATLKDALAEERRSIQEFIRKATAARGRT
ncbi:MAG: enoyl-CoA hydratase [bacterium]